MTENNPREILVNWDNPIYEALKEAHRKNETVVIELSDESVKVYAIPVSSDTMSVEEASKSLRRGLENLRSGEAGKPYTPNRSS